MIRGIEKQRFLSLIVSSIADSGSGCFCLDQGADVDRQYEQISDSSCSRKLLAELIQLI